MNTHVSFELAKLLKEKGYGNKATHKLNRNYYNHKGEYNGDVTDYVEAFVTQKELAHLETIDAPIIADVVMWLYEKYGIWIHVEYMDDVLLFGFSVCTIKTNTIEIEEWKFNSPTKAYEAAIEYVLTKLI